MDSDKIKKLQNYVLYLSRKGADEEKQGELVDAIGTYLKLVDVLLVMADAMPSYPQWLQCITSAESNQKKIKSLIARASLKEDQEKASPKPISIVQKAEPPKI
jgi:hypothetical protein